MSPQPEFFSKLASLPLRRLRELARVLGIPRYSAQARDGLLQAIASKSPAADTTTQPQDVVSSSPSHPQQVVTFSTAESPAPEPSATYLQVHPQDAQWAYCRWEISPTDREAVLAAGGGSLCLRLADITGLEIGRAHV